MATSLEYDDTSRIDTSRDKFKLYKYILPSSLEVDILNEFYLNETELEVFKTMYYCHIHSLNIFEMLLIKFKDIYTIEHALSKLSKLRLIMYYRNCNNFFQDCTFKIQHAANILFFETANNSDKYFDIINLDFTGILNYLADYSGEDQMKLFREFSILHWFIEEGVFLKLMPLWLKLIKKRLSSLFYIGIYLCFKINLQEHLLAFYFFSYIMFKAEKALK